MYCGQCSLLWTNFLFFTLLPSNRKHTQEFHINVKIWHLLTRHNRELQPHLAPSHSEYLLCRVNGRIRAELYRMCEILMQNWIHLDISRLCLSWVRWSCRASLVLVSYWSWPLPQKVGDTLSWWVCFECCLMNFNTFKFWFGSEHRGTVECHSYKYHYCNTGEWCDHTMHFYLSS